MGDFPQIIDDKISINNCARDSLTEIVLDLRLMTLASFLPPPNNMPGHLCKLTLFLPRERIASPARLRHATWGIFIIVALRGGIKKLVLFYF